MYEYDDFFWYGSIANMGVFHVMYCANIMVITTTNTAKPHWQVRWRRRQRHCRFYNHPLLFNIKFFSCHYLIIFIYYLCLLFYATPSNCRRRCCCKPFFLLPDTLFRNIYQVMNICQSMTTEDGRHDYLFIEAWDGTKVVCWVFSWMRNFGRKEGYVRRKKDVW